MNISWRSADSSGSVGKMVANAAHAPTPSVFPERSTWVTVVEEAKEPMCLSTSSAVSSFKPLPASEKTVLAMFVYANGCAGKSSLQYTLV